MASSEIEQTSLDKTFVLASSGVSMFVFSIDHLRFALKALISFSHPSTTVEFQIALPVSGDVVICCSSDNRVTNFLKKRKSCRFAV